MLADEVRVSNKNAFADSRSITSYAVGRIWRRENVPGNLTRRSVRYLEKALAGMGVKVSVQFQTSCPNAVIFLNRENLRSR